MITISKNLEQSLLKIAQQEHEPIDHLIERALTKFLEDYRDAVAGDAAIERLKTGKSTTISLEEWSRQLDEMED